jgi:hypothetical protein
MRLAVYETELNQTQARQHCATWSRHGDASLDSSGNPIARFEFDERRGSAIHNEVVTQPDLIIPLYLQIPQPMLLAPWKEIMPLWTCAVDIIRNIAGFMPIGIVLCLYFFADRRTVNSNVAGHHMRLYNDHAD